MRIQVNHERRTQTIAWIVMSLAFVTFIITLIGFPALTRWYILNAGRPLQVWLQPRAGIVAFQSRGRGDSALINDVREVISKSRITLSSGDAEALLLFYLPEKLEAPVSTLQLYGETEIIFTAAKTPRFARSELPHQISLNIIESKMLDVSVGGDGRATILQIQTPHGNFDLEEGTYTLAVDAARTDITVRRGRARIPDPAGSETIILTDFQNTELTAEGRGEVRSGRSRDILRNSDFQNSLSPYWTTFKQRKQLAEEDDGSVKHVIGERSNIVFERDGAGHIEIGITQEINQDIENITALHVTAMVKVDSQSIPLCGASGTECPVIIRITYNDTQGGSHEWLQGFYATSTDAYSDICTLCEGSPKHILVPQGGWYPYTSPDLLPLLQARGSDPATIEKVDVYASGHAFASAVSEISVLVEE